MAQPGVERRQRRRANVAAMATVVKDGIVVGRYVVQNLSAAGALLTGRDGAREGDGLWVRLEVPGRPQLVVRARVVRRAPAASDLMAMAIAFRHSDADGEDAVQQVVLDALEDRERSEPFFKDAEHYNRARA